MTRLLVRQGDLERDAEQARNDQAAAESDFKTARRHAALGAQSPARDHRTRPGGGRPRGARARSSIRWSPINSPIDGTVIARKVGPGQYVRSDAGDPLYAIADLSTMWLKANVPEMDIALVRVGQEIEVKVTALPDRVFKARIIAIGAASDASTRRVVVRSEIPNPGPRAQVGNVRELQDRDRRGRVGARGAGRCRDPGRRGGGGLGRARADGVRAPHGRSSGASRTAASRFAKVSRPANASSRAAPSSSTMSGSNDPGTLCASVDAS